MRYTASVAEMMASPTATTASTSSTATASSKQQQQHRPLHHSTSNIEVRSDLLHLAAMELEGMSISSSSSDPSSSITNATATTTAMEELIEIESPFPPGCLHLLYSLPSNSSCHDCHSHPAHWASVSYGITLCLQCSGKHRSLGVHTSVVKSLQLDSWKRREVLCMLEGGNEQLTRFFDRHEMGCESISISGRNDYDCPIGAAVEGNKNDNVSWLLDRYKTKAASFYRQHLMGHAARLSREGLYGGREASREGGRGISRSGERRELNRLVD